MLHQLQPCLFESGLGLRHDLLVDKRLTHRVLKAVLVYSIRNESRCCIQHGHLRCEGGVFIKLQTIADYSSLVLLFIIRAMCSAGPSCRAGACPGLLTANESRSVERPGQARPYETVRFLSSLYLRMLLLSGFATRNRGQRPRHRSGGSHGDKRPRARPLSVTHLIPARLYGFPPTCRSEYLQEA
jgi:hypothetical protein